MQRRRAVEQRRSGRSFARRNAAGGSAGCRCLEPATGNKEDRDVDRLPVTEASRSGPLAPIRADFRTSSRRGITSGASGRNTARRGTCAARARARRLAVTSIVPRAMDRPCPPADGVLATAIGRWSQPDVTSPRRRRAPTSSWSTARCFTGAGALPSPRRSPPSPAIASPRSGEPVSRSRLLRRAVHCGGGRRRRHPGRPPLRRQPRPFPERLAQPHQARPE